MVKFGLKLKEEGEGGTKSIIIKRNLWDQGI